MVPELPSQGIRGVPSEVSGVEFSEVETFSTPLANRSEEGWVGSPSPRSRLDVEINFPEKFGNCRYYYFRVYPCYFVILTAS